MITMDRRSFLAAGLGLLSGPAFAQSSVSKAQADLDVLVVNTASLCSFVGQFAGLQTLWERYSARGLEIIAVPSNDFGGQEPGGAEEIHHAAAGYGVSFPIAAKARVLGENAHPFYRWAAVERPRDLPRWNFHKYLVGRDGRIADVFSTITDPTSATVMRAVEREFRSMAG